MRISFLVFLIALLSTVGLSGQRTTVFTESYAPMKSGQEWYDLHLFQQAKQDLYLFLEEPRAIPDHISQIQKEWAGLIASQAAIRAEDPLAERKILEFARSTSPDPMGNQALLEAAHYFFNAREYAQAVHFYDMVNSAGLGDKARTELAFKKGYCQFVQKDFAKARQTLAPIKDKQGDYYDASNYYYGMTLFFEGKYEEVLSSFRRIEKTRRYGKYMPYIISQILFAQGKYDELISYATTKISGEVENRKEIEQLIGRAYFEQKRYPEALSHLTYYADRSTSMAPADYYQLGYSQYKSGAYENAITNLEPLSRTSDLMGQNALFILGDAYLKSGQKNAARNAFMQASKLDHDEAIREDALFQYGKLSYELRADKEAAIAFTTISDKSKFYTEAQSLLGELLIKTKEIDFALDYLSKSPLKTAQLKEAYQKVHYAKAAQLVDKNQLEEAIPFLKKSLTVTIDSRTQAMANFLLGDIYHRQNKFKESQDEINRFLTLARTQSDLPEEASIYMGHYIQGYNLLKSRDYGRATGYFQDAVSGIKQQAQRIYLPQIRGNILGDAIIRTGDCYFKVNQYKDALKFYEDAIRNKIAGFHYARFQKGLILGLQGKPVEKILELEELVESFPNSDYADNALFEIGNTFMDLAQFTEAIKPYRRLIQEYDKSSNLLNASRLKLGLISYNLGDVQEAIRHYKDVLNNNPDPEEHVAALSALEEIYVRDLASPDDYAAILEESGVSLSESSRDSLNFRSADNLYQSGQYQRAIQGYTQYLERFPRGLHVLQAHYRRGECFRVDKQYVRALVDYEKVIQRGNSRYYEDALSKAAPIAYTYSQDIDKAFKYYQLWEEAASNETARFEAQQGALQAAYKAGREADVLAYAAKVQSNQQVSDSQKGLALFYSGKVNYDQKNNDQALVQFKEVRQLRTDELAGEAHYLAADIYFQKRDMDNARKECLASNQQIPGQDYWVAKCVLLLADIFIEEKDLFNARAALESLLENYFGDETIRKTATEKIDYISVLENKDTRLTQPLTNDLLDLQEE